MSNDENKSSFIIFLLEEWKQDKYAPKLQGRQILFGCEEKCIRLKSINGQTTLSEEVEELCSNQEEADTKIVLHCLHVAANSADDATISVRSPDTDVFVLLLNFSQHIKQTVLFDTGNGDKRRLLNLKSIIADTGEDVCKALPALHAYSGCDTTSAFVRRGKVAALKLLQKHPDFLETFMQLGTSNDIPEFLFDKLEQFTCRLYGSPSLKNINKLRHQKFQQRFSLPSTSCLLNSYTGMDMSLLPPCRDTLRMHLKRVNYQACIWLSADQPMPSIPKPAGNGWEFVDGKLEIKWTDGHFMPQELVEILVEQPQQEQEDEDQEEPGFDNVDEYFLDED